MGGTGATKFRINFEPDRTLVANAPWQIYGNPEALMAKTLYS